MNIGIPILLADLSDWLVPLAALMIGVFRVISYLAESKKKAEPQPRPRQQPQRKQVAPGQPEGAVAEKPANDNVRNEVEEFLRRVRQPGDGEQRPQRKRDAEQPRRPRIEVLVEDTGDEVALARTRPGTTRPGSARPGQRPLPSKQPAAAPVATATAASVPLERRHLAEGRVTDHAKHLGEQIGQTDERLQTHLHQKFDHHLGKLGSRDSNPVDQVATALATTPASEIAALLATPQGMQQAVILSEIFQRPTDRW